MFISYQLLVLTCTTCLLILVSIPVLQNFVLNRTTTSVYVVVVVVVGVFLRWGEGEVNDKWTVLVYLLTAQSAFTLHVTFIPSHTDG